MITSARTRASSESAGCGRRASGSGSGCSSSRARISSRPVSRRASSPSTCSRRARTSTRGSSPRCPSSRIRRVSWRSSAAPTSIVRDVRPVGLALWQVADPGNVGTLIRSADAFGAFVALSEGCADPTSSKALRASAGAIFRVPLVGFENTPALRIALVARGGEPLATIDLPERVTFVLGAERDGVPAEVLERCDAVASIPMAPARVAQRRRSGRARALRAPPQVRTLGRAFPGFARRNPRPVVVDSLLEPPGEILAAPQLGTSLLRRHLLPFLHLRPPSTRRRSCTRRSGCRTAPP